MSFTFAKFTENPALAILSSVTLLLTTVHTLVGSLGLAPFWSDSLISLTLGLTAIYWVTNMVRNRKRSDRVVGISKPVSKKPRILNVTARIDASLFVFLLLIGLFVWKGFAPICHLVSPKWTLCGTFVASCPIQPCLELFDYKGRKLHDHCLYFDDDTGYKNLVPPNWSTYKPESFTVSCQGNTSPQTDFPQSMFDSSCEARVEVP
jgi:hypothetical protein